MITCDLADTTEIEGRLSLAQLAFNDFRKILCSQIIYVKLRSQLYLIPQHMHQVSVRYKALALPHAQNLHSKHPRKTGYSPY